jgi:translation initiation factor 1
MRSEDPTVYSTQTGRVCPKCGRPVSACICKKQAAAARPAGDGVVRVGRESKGRKGKTVTLITGLSLPEGDAHALLSDLKRACGSDGAYKDGVLEIQGDHRDAVIEELKKRGIKAKKVG